MYFDIPIVNLVSKAQKALNGKKADKAKTVSFDNFMKNITASAPEADMADRGRAVAKFASNLTATEIHRQPKPEVEKEKSAAYGNQSDEAVIGRLADMLCIAPAQVEHMLAELNMKPLELAVAENMKSFLEKLSGDAYDMSVGVVATARSAQSAGSGEIGEAWIAAPWDRVPPEAAVYEDVSSYARTVGSERDMETVPVSDNDLNDLFVYEENVSDTTSQTASEYMTAPVRPEIIRGAVIPNEPTESITDFSPHVDDATDLLHGADETAELFSARIRGIIDEIDTQYIDDEEYEFPDESLVNVVESAPSEQSTEVFEIPVEAGEGLVPQDDEQILSRINPQNGLIGQTTSGSAATVRHEPITPARVIEQIVERFEIDPAPRVSEIKITLKPESLGDVTLRVQSENGLISAQFLAENQRVKEIMESSMNSLRDALSQQGVNVSQLSVSVGQDESNGAQNQSRRGDYGQARRVMNRLTADMESAAGSPEPLAMYDSRVSFTA
jgi:hypothetical protein